MPLLAKGRIEVYLPDLLKPSYQNLLQAFDDEFTFAFGGCTIVRRLDGSYLSNFGKKIQDRINLISPIRLIHFKKMKSYFQIIPMK